ncbi:dihydrolipoyllysine-residue succinyltransferase [Candidatus Providencia siddallii]|uniref:Dihydrolipoyllysine-residue succinyltransferase component of 2-oxoglutarate dehydrogenase complex n=1 Tax=Candidatus Providencia siddallii TaxID=1715285 RepID=A0ABM9NNF0_9GAMM
MNNIEILVPDLPESVADATVITWHKKQGDFVYRDEILVEIETDKVILEIPASIDGILKIDVKEGTIVLSKQHLGSIKPTDQKNNFKDKKNDVSIDTEVKTDKFSSPTVRRMIAEHDLNLHKEDIKGTGVGGRLTRKDINKILISKTIENKDNDNNISLNESNNRVEKRVSMTRLRKRIAERLLESKKTTAMLTTFNEVNMSPIKELRKKYGEIFEERYGIRLGFMSFYVKAVVEALKRYPEINASIDGDDIVYYNYFDISIAVSTPRGLVTPVLRDADKISMANLEKEIKKLALKGRDSKLTIEEMTGGSFTITNGGIFGSLMSTPIINLPQSSILGMHAIKDRPMVVNGKIEILPMMYLALSYDHCLIDGRESVGFLNVIKNMLEDPARMLLEI